MITDTGSEKRLRVIMEQLLPDITEDIRLYDVIDFRLDYIGRLEVKAYSLAESQEIYSIDDIGNRFKKTYENINDIIKDKIKAKEVSEDVK